MKQAFNTPQFDFYGQLHYFLSQQVVFPMVALELKRKHTALQDELSFSKEVLSSFLTIHKVENESTKRIILASIVKFVFRDLVCKFQDEQSLTLFAEFLNLTEQEDHLYVMHLKPDPQFPLQVTTITNNPSLFKEHKLTPSGHMIHVFYEK